MTRFGFNTNAKSEPSEAGVVGSNFLRLLSDSPVAEAVYRGSIAALAGGGLSARERELVGVAMAEINGSTYCLTSHCTQAKELGLSDEQIRLARKAASEVPRTHALLRFVQAVTLQRGDISDADFQALRRAGFSDSLIAEVIANVAVNIFSNYFNRVVRTENDFPLVKSEA
jgi:uncharacterized peroxidase-related enzyme